ncbi:MAG: type secretion system rane protein PorP/SprF [Flavipsychrobacter sp.]|nr:type secretion system rane protein PorP/SprF [Flavipsychrobacter sp.]
MLLLCVLFTGAHGQSLHYSQYYNAPLLLNPANTALMPENDFRVGLNYRTQWAVIPVPYNTFSAYGDCKIGGNRNNENHNNWLGVGLAFFSDKAGDGNLSLSELQGDLAYHLQLSKSIMLSVGGSAATITRSVNFDNLLFDNQWDGFTFNGNMGTGEKVGILKSNYYTIAAGANLAWFPNENVYVKLGGDLQNINTPAESFYGSTKNLIGYRTIANLDVTMRTGQTLIVNPSVYFTTQYGANELVGGSLFRMMMSSKNQMTSQLILGAFFRNADAIIGVAGYQVGDIQFMANYDFTISGLAPYNASYGALEFSAVYSRAYHPNDGIRKTYNCPRF